MTAPYGVHWFRRDLRWQCNPALQKNLAQNNNRVLGFFCFDPVFLSRPDFSPHRFQFFLKTLEKLQSDMRSFGGDLVVMNSGPDLAFPELIQKLTLHFGDRPALVSFNRDYEPFARARDARMGTLFREKFSLATYSARDHLLIEPTELTKPDGGFYSVYSPFKKKWLALFQGSYLKSADEMIDIPARVETVKKNLTAKPPQFLFTPGEQNFFRELNKPEVLAKTLAENSKKTDLPLPEVGHVAALWQLEQFAKKSLENYPVGRDIPSISGTSHLSVYLKHGAITVPQIIARLSLHSGSSYIKFFEELIWREFYYHILFHRPDVETQAFHEKYRTLAWENDPKLFRAWCEGKTGYPIVDAGMRQLNQTGWMHNRVRMIVASFLTKDLLIDYRWGEKYFMEKLLDGDLAPNNGGWQWAASTGCDPQPYFRIFNPTSQSEKFDPQGIYIKQYLPERAHLTGKALHQSIDPIVEHKNAREKALKLYKSARK